MLFGCRLWSNVAGYAAGLASRCLFSSSNDNTVRVWSIYAGYACVAVIPAPIGNVLSLRGTVEPDACRSTELESLRLNSRADRVLVPLTAVSAFLCASLSPRGSGRCVCGVVCTPHHSVAVLWLRQHCQRGRWHAAALLLPALRRGCAGTGLVVVPRRWLPGHVRVRGHAEGEGHLHSGVHPTDRCVVHGSRRRRLLLWRSTALVACLGQWRWIGQQRTRHSGSWSTQCRWREGCQHWDCPWRIRRRCCCCYCCCCC